MKRLSVLFFFWIITVFSSCKSGTLSAEDYIKWVRSNDNPLSKNKSIGDLLFNARLLTTEEQVLTNYSDNLFNLTKQTYSKEEEKVKGLLAFNLTIDMANGKGNVLKHGVNSPEEFSDNQYYFFYHFKDDIFLLADGHKYPCRLYNFERRYGLGSKVSVALAFDKPINYQEGFTLEINPVIYNMGKVNIEYSKSDINNLPKLKLNS
jgi:hypothetical protein